MFRLKDVSPKPSAPGYLPLSLILSLPYIYYVDKKTNDCEYRVLCLLKVHAGVVGQLAALLVPGAGHSADAEVVQDAAAAAMPPGHDGGGTGRAEQPSGLEILGGLDTQLGGARWNAARVTIGLSTNRAVNEPPRRFSGRSI